MPHFTFQDLTRLRRHQRDVALQENLSRSIAEYWAYETNQVHPSGIGSSKCYYYINDLARLINAQYGSGPPHNILTLSNLSHPYHHHKCYRHYRRRHRHHRVVLSILLLGCGGGSQYRIGCEGEYGDRKFGLQCRVGSKETSFHQVSKEKRLQKSIRRPPFKSISSSGYRPLDRVVPL